MRTLRQQILLANIATTAAAILLAIALMFSAEIGTWKEALVRDILIKADIIGSQCTAALIFNSPRDAEEILGALRADRQIEFAAVYSQAGKAFASYRRGGLTGEVPKSAPRTGHAFESDHLQLTRPILLDAEQVGTITIRVGLERLREALGKYLAVSLGVLLLAVLAAYIMLLRLQRSVTAPVTDLVRLMERVSRDKDYSPRADQRGPVELVSLAGSFNDMLSVIQARDRELERSLGELREAYRKLKDLDRLKSNFLSTVSHELRTPLTSIRAFVELLMLKPNMREERQKRIIGTITDESDRLVRLINDLLDLSRIESGVLQWRDVYVEINDVVRSAMDSVQPLAVKKGVTVRGTTADGLPEIRADRDRIMQVVMNLLSNAVKFTPEGGTISLATSRTEHPPEVSVAISDTGRGIPPDELESIFEKFHRSDDALTGSVEGTGLGLAIAREIIDHYGGRIWATSEPGRGSTFTFTLPLGGARFAARDKDSQAREP